jgi:thymidylate synthase
MSSDVSNDYENKKNEKIPVITIQGKNIPAVWESSVLSAWSDGAKMYTEYNQWSKDCSMLIVVDEPFSEPRVHMGGLCGGLDDLAKYVGELVHGTEDHFVYEGRRPYEYHERLEAYTTSDTITDQIDYIVRKLSEKKSVELDGRYFEVYGYSRRAMGITWKPWVDEKSEHPPCLQYAWCRIVGNKLVMETTWRSRDAYKAAFWNMFAITELQREIARKVSEDTGKEIAPGQYVDFSNSYHIYENDFKDFKVNNIEGRFLKLVNERPWEKRTMTTEQFFKQLKGMGSMEDVFAKYPYLRNCAPKSF